MDKAETDTFRKMQIVREKMARYNFSFMPYKRKSNPLHYYPHIPPQLLKQPMKKSVLQDQADNSDQETGHAEAGNSPSSTGRNALSWLRSGVGLALGGSASGGDVGLPGAGDDGGWGCGGGLLLLLSSSGGGDGGWLSGLRGLGGGWLVGLSGISLGFGFGSLGGGGGASGLGISWLWLRVVLDAKLRSVLVLASLLID